MESRKSVPVVLENFSIWCDWDANEDTDILTALWFNQSFFKINFKYFLPWVFYLRLKHGEPASSGKLPDQKLHE